MRKADIRWSWDHGDVEPAALKALYEAAGFAFLNSTGDPGLARLFGPGVFGLFAYSAGDLIGASRVFSDDLTTTWLAEICVAPSWRRYGVGRALLEGIDSRFGDTALYCDGLTETVDFFQAVGVRPKRKLIACRRFPGGAKAEMEDIPGIVVHDDASRYGSSGFEEVAEAVGFGISERGMPRDVLYRKLFGDGVFGAFAESQECEPVGFVRAFSDGLTKSYVAEICVHPQWQRKGIGRALVDRMVHRFSHTAVYTEAFPEAVSLFEACGIVRDPGLVGCSRAPLSR